MNRTAQAASAWSGATGLCGVKLHSGYAGIDELRPPRVGLVQPMSPRPTVREVERVGGA